MPSSLNGTGVTFNDATTLQTGNIPAANLGSGTANSTTFLRGDKTWVAPPAGFSGAQTISSAVDVTLTAASPQVLNLDMTVADKAVILPDATTLTAGTPVYSIINRGWISFNVVTASSFAVATVNPGDTVRFTLVSNATAGGVWSTQDASPAFAQRIGNDVIESFATSGVTQITDTTFLLANRTAVTNGQSSVTASTYEYKVGTLAAGVLTYGTPVTVTYTGDPGGTLLKVGSGVFLARFYRSDDGSPYGTPNVSYHRLRGIRVSGTTITVGAEVTASTFNQGGGAAQSHYASMFSMDDGNAMFGVWRAQQDLQFSVSGRLRYVLVNADASITLGSEWDPGNTQWPTGGIRLTATEALVNFNPDAYYGAGTSGTRVVTLSGTSLSGGTNGTNAGGYFRRVNDNTAMGYSNLVTRSGTSIVSVVALNAAVNGSVQRDLVFNNVHPMATTAQQITGTTVGSIKNITYGGVAGSTRFKNASDEFIAFTTGANLRYGVFKVIA